MVESDRGDILSPKKDPTTMAPQVIGTGMPSPMPTPSSATPAVAKVPQLVPDTTDITVQIKQVTSRKILGLISFRPRSIIMGIVPLAIQTPTSMPVSIRTTTGTPIPLMPLLISSSISPHLTPCMITKMDTTVADISSTIVVSRDQSSFPTIIVPRDNTTAINALPKDNVFFSMQSSSL